MPNMDYAKKNHLPDGTGKVLITEPGIPDGGSYSTEIQLLHWIAANTVVKGYLYNGAFYEDSGHVTALTPSADFVYIDLSTKGLYRWTGSVYEWLMPSTILKTSDIVDNTSSTATDKPLSAKQGKALNDEISQLKGRGRFLSLWNCATGQPVSFPLSTPYAYNAGDYFIVSTVDDDTNYMPDGSSYTGAASSTLESDAVNVNDTYIYDGTLWLLQKNTGNDIHLSVVNGEICVTFIVEDYDPAELYAVGDFCYENSKSYICIHPTTGTFNASDWKEI